MGEDYSGGVDFRGLERRALELLPPRNEAGSGLQLICELLRDEVPRYDWVGFYFAVPRQHLLVLGPFAGTPTEHVRIPYGRGICGQAAESLGTVVVPDVSAAENYLSCSLETKAEIVVPVFLHDTFIAEIDIDSHTAGPFGPEDEAFLSRLARAVAPHLPAVFHPSEHEGGSS